MESGKLIVLTIFITLSVIEILGCFLIIDKPRKPFTVGAAFGYMFRKLVLIFGLLYLSGVLF